MQGPEWLRLLDAWYEAGEDLVKKIKEEDKTYRWAGSLKSVTDLNNSQKQQKLRYMEDTGLIEEYGDDGSMRLTRRGLQVAHDRELGKRQEEILNQQKEVSEKSASIYTLLVVAVSIQAIATGFSAGGVIGIGVAVLSLLVVYGLFVFQGGSFRDLLARFV